MAEVAAEFGVGMARCWCGKISCRWLVTAGWRRESWAQLLAAIDREAEMGSLHCCWAEGVIEVAAAVGVKKGE
ncbi:hypothetical protein AMTR_s02740p00008080 [Amborella trichopoda]|uniref:Uncharacterized protein n=1 Tax=Amborella trichopoda TaxID=13333 RepID=U5CVJ5_AMBTC|nr:hypothetical protein AMTR_s02740p00008080 [Amborella trichopoda]